MTRKRFKKLLMSYGYSRNEAECKSLCARRFYESYDVANHAYLHFYELSKVVFDFTNAVLTIGKTFAFVRDEVANIVNIVNNVTNSIQLGKDDADERKLKQSGAEDTAEGQDYAQEEGLREQACRFSVF